MSIFSEAFSPLMRALLGAMAAPFFWLARTASGIVLWGIGAALTIAYVGMFFSSVVQLVILPFTPSWHGSAVLLSTLLGLGVITLARRFWATLLQVSKKPAASAVVVENATLVPRRDSHEVIDVQAREVR